MEEDSDPKFTSLCNIKTIQEEARGFFSSLVENITINTRIRQWAEDMWKKPLYGEDFIKSLINQDDIFSNVLKTFTVTEVYRKKCDKTANKLFIEAQQLWKAQQWQQCREKCSQAQLRAPIAIYSSKTLTSKTQETNLFSQILLLRAHCLLKEEKTNLVKADINASLQHGPLTDSLKQFLREILRELKIVNSNSSNSPCIGLEKEIPLSGGEHADIVSASKLLKISENERQGRFISAADNINIGDNLVVENPYAACLNPQYFGTHCHNCFTRLEAPFGCPDCATVAFCGEKCYKTAITTYHQYECKFIDLFIGSGMSILCHVALRMVTQIGLHEVIKIFNHYVKKSPKTEDHNLQGNKSHHGAIYKLVTHERYRKPEDYANRTLMALFLTRCLQKTLFFTEGKTSKNQDDQSYNTFGSEEIAVWSVLLFNLQVLQFNAHQVCGLRGDKELGCAIYSTASLFNHDCSPTIIRYFLGKKLVIKALRPISAGQAVGDSYGPQWGRAKAGSEMNREIRKKELRSRYWFNCQCLPCSQQWPVPPPQTPYIKCSNLKCTGSLEVGQITEEITCKMCNTTASMEYIFEKQDSIEKCLGKIEEALAIQNKGGKTFALERTLIEYSELTHQPSPLTLRAEDAVRSYYATKLSHITNSEKCDCI